MCFCVSARACVRVTVCMRREGGGGGGELMQIVIIVTVPDILQRISVRNIIYSI